MAFDGQSACLGTCLWRRWWSLAVSNGRASSFMVEGDRIDLGYQCMSHVDTQWYWQIEVHWHLQIPYLMAATGRRYCGEGTRVIMIM